MDHLNIYQTYLFVDVVVAVSVAVISVVAFSQSPSCLRWPFLSHEYYLGLEKGQSRQKV